jgi:hypothetical protein
VFLAGITHVCEDQVVDDCTNLWMQIADLFEVIDPHCVLPQTPEPSNVIIYHGTHSENPSYTTGSPTEMPIPKEEAHTFPIIFDSDNLPIIFNNHEPYISTTVQHQFKMQACISMTAIYEANKWACPDNPSQLWHQSFLVHHVAHPLPAFIHTFIHLRNIPHCGVKAVSGKKYMPGMYDVVHLYAAVVPNLIETPNTMIGRYTITRDSRLQLPVLYIVPVETIDSPTIGIQDVGGSVGANEEHLFLIRRMAHWPASWDSMWGRSPFQLSPGY